MGYKSRVDLQLAEQRRVNELQHAEQRRVVEVQLAKERARYEQRLFDAAFHADYQEWRRAMTAPARSMDGKDG
ncbi:hypothetical protein GPECTOR_15g429 [Gonium pectorale]|uniref:Uncharacterized protein n=1 Tax=Gonium pectorale TaxID=33097 RepID=A0A150GLR1_GONPE|nr:hypothetical protein GPECTOR_15g429 [Gonium pectorale]|eukprot:KXZ50744.1 hypothetical protein GPECTOR_15g429 [Gonium pectorale]